MHTFSVNNLRFTFADSIAWKMIFLYINKMKFIHKKNKAFKENKEFVFPSIVQKQMCRIKT